jgi:hypothetical protein
MRVVALFAIAAIPLAVSAQDTPKTDPNRTAIEVIGCVKGSVLQQVTLSETGERQPHQSLRWRLRAPKALMKQIKSFAGKELEITGSTKNPPAGVPIGSSRVGRTDIYIGNPQGTGGRDPLPESPTIDVESFKVTGERCP